MLRVLVLVSGQLGMMSLRSLMDNELVQVRGVFTDSKSHEIQEFCVDNQIPQLIGNPRKLKTIILEEFKEKIGMIDVLFSINYLFIVDENIIKIPRLYALNIHGSLLPKYRGRTPHVWAIINGESITGITIHKIEKGVDTGDILLQKEIEITEDDTGAIILERFAKWYPILINQSIAYIQNNQVDFKVQDVSKATYFGKRTPKDGRINWNWDKHRIRNWVRAQAAPYPGAYTYLGTEKIVIHEVQYSDFGYLDELDNGLILRKLPLTIKTCNGALEITNYKGDSQEDINLNIGDRLK